MLWDAGTGTGHGGSSDDVDCGWEGDQADGSTHYQQQQKGLANGHGVDGHGGIALESRGEEGVKGEGAEAASWGEASASEGGQAGSESESVAADESPWEGGEFTDPLRCKTPQRKLREADEDEGVDAAGVVDDVVAVAAAGRAGSPGVGVGVEGEGEAVCRSPWLPGLQLYDR